ncbi:MAG: RDD family protein [Deltaproteobacteria bacterium]|nr:RDD family protein [Deltaproteobacteria bacterium]
MPTGFDLLEHNSALRKHWLKRIGAMLIDAAIVFIPIRIALLFLDFSNQDIMAGVLSGVAWFVYGGLLEGRFGKTVGKRLLHLRVVSLVETRSLHQTFVRNVPKVFWYIFLPLDVLVGLSLEGDPRQRWTDTVAKTSVISYEPELAKIKKRSEPAKIPKTDS